MQQASRTETFTTLRRWVRLDDARLGNLAAVLLSIVALVSPAVVAAGDPRADDFNVIAHLVRALDHDQRPDAAPAPGRS